jgi:hypothetical protein
MKPFSKQENRLTLMSSGPFLRNAPKEIHFELYSITRLLRPKFLKQH